MSRINVVVIDPDRATTENVERGLAFEMDACISIYEHGEAGWKAIRAQVPDLVILEMDLPGLDGISICRTLRTFGLTQKIAIIVVSYRALETDKIVALDSGADQYLVKPFTIGELSAHIKAILRRQNTAGPDKVATQHLSSGNLVINVPAHTVWLEGRTLPLRRRQFSLLVALMQKQGTVVTYEEIQRLVWKDEVIKKARETINSYVYVLRQAIEPDPMEPTRIVVFPGRGYMFQK